MALCRSTGLQQCDFRVLTKHLQYYLPCSGIVWLLEEQFQERFGVAMVKAKEGITEVTAGTVLEHTHNNEIIRTV